MVASLFAAAHQGVTIRLDDTPVAFSAEDCDLLDDRTYYIINAAHMCIDPNTALEISDDGNPVDSADIEFIDYLHGIIRFASGYVVATPVQITAGNYIPFDTVGSAESFDFKLSNDLIEKSVFGNSAKRFAAGLSDFSGTIGTISFVDETIGVESLAASLAAGTTRIMQIDVVADDAGTPLGGNGIRWMGLVKLSGADTGADPASLVKSPLTFEGAAQMSVDGPAGSHPVSWSLIDGKTLYPVDMDPIP
jgi:hypothetical protein